VYTVATGREALKAKFIFLWLYETTLLFKGDLGGSSHILNLAQRYVYTVAYKERGFKTYSPSLQGKGLGVRSVLNSAINRSILLCTHAKIKTRSLLSSPK